MFIDHTVYRKVFQNYIRNGTPIERSLKGSQDEFNDPTDIGELQRRLENEDARDVDILDPTRIGEMIYETYNGLWTVISVAARDCLDQGRNNLVSSRVLHIA